MKIDDKNLIELMRNLEETDFNLMILLMKRLNKNKVNKKKTR